MSLCWSCSFLFRRLLFSGSGGTETSAVPGGPEVFVPPSVPWTQSGTSTRTPSCATSSRCFSGFLRGFLFRPSGGAILDFFYLLGLVAVFLVLGFGFSCSVRFPGVWFLRFFFGFPVSGVFFLCLHSCILHLFS